MGNPHDDHRQRMRQEFRDHGMDHWPDHKKLEMALFYGKTRGDTNELAHTLLERFGSLSGVFDAPIEMLEEVVGIGPAIALNIKFFSAIVRAYMDDRTVQHDIIECSEDAKEYMRYKFLCQGIECVYLIGLGNNGKVILFSKLADGSPETVEISPAKVVRTALRANVGRVLLAHNHPHGICNPSSRDVHTTTILYQELIRVEVELLDHIIVADDGVCSMREQEMMPQGSSTSYVRVRF